MSEEREPNGRTRRFGWPYLFLAWSLLVALGALIFVTLQALGPPLPPRAHEAPLTRAPAAAPEPGGAAAEPAALAARPAPPWRRFAAAAPEGGGPAIALVLTGLGLSAEATEAAIGRLPPVISLSFSPYGKNLVDWMERARAAGHEVLLDLPLEPLNYPREDPGPQGLMTSLSPEENLGRLAWIAGQGREFVGFTAVMGSRFLAEKQAVTPLLRALAGEGYLLLGSGEADGRDLLGLARAEGLPFVPADRRLDTASGGLEVVEARLAEIERLAQRNGGALALVRALPAIVEALPRWSEGLAARGITLVPASALAEASQ